MDLAELRIPLRLTCDTVGKIFWLISGTCAQRRYEQQQRNCRSSMPQLLAHEPATPARWRAQRALSGMYSTSTPLVPAMSSVQPSAVMVMTTRREGSPALARGDHARIGVTDVPVRS